MRNRLTSVTKTPQNVSDQRKDRNADDSGKRKHHPLQGVDLLGVFAFGLPRVLRCISCTTGQEDGTARCKPQTNSAQRHYLIHLLEGTQVLLRICQCAVVTHGTTTAISWPSRPGTVSVYGPEDADGLLILRINA